MTARDGTPAITGIESVAMVTALDVPECMARLATHCRSAASRA